MILFRFRVTVVFLIVLTGCDSTKPPISSPDVTVEKIWHGESEHIANPEVSPDFDISAIPTVDNFESVGEKYEISIDRNGQLYRHGKKISQSAIIEELKANKNISDTAVIVTGDAEIRISIITELRRTLSASVPELRRITFVAEPNTESE
jgi:biopolymer transport protein ExbD